MLITVTQTAWERGYHCSVPMTPSIMRFHCIECKLLASSLSGKGNLSNVAMYKQWNNLTHTSGWREVNGTDGGDILGGEGVLFNPQISRDQKLYAFISQLFRYVYCIWGIQHPACTV